MTSTSIKNSIEWLKANCSGRPTSTPLQKTVSCADQVQQCSDQMAEEDGLNQLYHHSSQDEGCIWLLFAGIDDGEDHSLQATGVMLMQQGHSVWQGDHHDDQS